MMISDYDDTSGSESWIEDAKRLRKSEDACSRAAMVMQRDSFTLFWKNNNVWSNFVHEKWEFFTCDGVYKLMSAWF